MTFDTITKNVSPVNCVTKTNYRKLSMYVVTWEANDVTPRYPNN